MASVIVLALLFPALGAMALAWLGPRLSHRQIAWVGVGSVSLAFLVAVAAFVRLASLPAAHRLIQDTLFTWNQAAGAPIHFSLLVDPISVLFMLVITGVGALIHLYSAGYMDDDEGFGRFFWQMNLFIVAMLLLVMAGNFFFLLVGWAGVGLASYFLIGFWYTRPAAVAAAKKAFVVNVVGDVALTLAIFLLFVNLGHIGYQTVFRQFATLPIATRDLVAALLFVAAAAKSAQFPLHVWLPDAMEGPTPVSALIHAATMVTAGVYLVARAYPIFGLAPGVATTVAWVGGFTALFAATIAIAQDDIKRVLAYSTVSQLGYMFMAVGTAAYAAGVFHFLTHAFFKALLFLAAGSVIHALGGEQDMWKMGGLRRTIPLTAACFLVGTLAISGIPPFAGFFSKDEILGGLLSTGQVGLWAIGTLAAGLTAFYMFRLYFVVFGGSARAPGHAHESPSVMTAPLVVLAVLSTVGGFLVLPGGYNLIESWLLPALTRFGPTPPLPPATNWAAMGVSLAMALAGGALAWSLYGRRQVASEPLAGALYRALKGKWYIDELGEFLIVRPALWLGAQLGRFDRQGLDQAFNQLGRLVAGWGESLRPSQSGYVRRYALTFALGVLLVVAFLSVHP